MLSRNEKATVPSVPKLTIALYRAIVIPRFYEAILLRQGLRSSLQYFDPDMAIKPDEYTVIQIYVHT